MRRVISLSLILMVGVLFSGLVFGEFQPGTKRVVTAGEDLDIKGVILSRDGETFVLRDLTKTDTVVLLTDSTTIKSAKKGLFRGGKEFDVTALVPGLILTVKGKGDTEGRLMADKITFKDSDYKAAVTAFAMTDPVDDKADQALQDAAKADQRISDLDDYDVVKVVTVYFAVNKADLSAEGKDLPRRTRGEGAHRQELQGRSAGLHGFYRRLQQEPRTEPEARRFGRPVPGGDAQHPAAAHRDPHGLRLHQAGRRRQDQGGPGPEPPGGSPSPRQQGARHPQRRAGCQVAGRAEGAPPAGT